MLKVMYMKIRLYKLLNQILTIIVDCLYELSAIIYTIEAMTALKYIEWLKNKNVNLKHQINHNDLLMNNMKEKYKNRVKVGK